MNRTISRVSVLILAFAFSMLGAAPANNERQDDKQAAGEANESTWIGKLVDQTCKDKHIDRNCPVSPGTQRFGLVIDGGIIVPFDDASNLLAREAVAKGNYKGNVEVLVIGGRQNGGFKVESIQVSK